MNSIKLISRYGVHNLNGKCIVNRKVLHFLKYNFYYSTSYLSKEYDISEDEDTLKKIIYNEVLGRKKPIVKKFEPICLKYLKQNNEVEENSSKKDKKKEEEVVHFPYDSIRRCLPEGDKDTSKERSFSELVQNFTPSDTEKIKIPQWYLEDCSNIPLHKLERLDCLISEDVLKEEIELIKFGSCNPNKKISHIPCGGCGALLQCNDASLPGFIPAEVFESRSKKELYKEICQRCQFLKEFDIALGVNVSPTEYSKLINEIKDKKALVIIMVDLLDFPCSIFPGIFDLIGPTNPVIIIGNKVDLLIKEGPWFLKRFKEALMWSLMKQKVNLENVKHVGLISAKTGYGIEYLIDLLFKNWDSKGDVYLVGCTNVGKSTLFNSLINSDYCKVKAFELMHRATVSAWPGTTLNLLKFPIMKAQEWRMIVRSKRLRIVLQGEEKFMEFHNARQNIRLEQIPLQEYVGRSFAKEPDPCSVESNDLSIESKKGIQVNDPDFARNNWFHDTPGVIQEDQIINYLTTSELLLTIPKKMLLPRNFHLQPGHSLFIGGLARLDYINGADFVWFTVFASMELPITVTKSEDADYIYQKLLGSPLFRVPMKGKERLSKWPGLSPKKFEIYGNLPKNFEKFLQEKNTLTKEADADVVLSSAGWISVTVPLGYRCSIKAWTPNGKGIYLRNFPIIKYGHTFKGEKIPKTPAFKTEMKEVEIVSLEKELKQYQ